MSIYNLDNLKDYWVEGEGMASFPLMKKMTEKTFWRIFSVVHFTGKKCG
jgi:hypothetical protein